MACTCTHFSALHFALTKLAGPEYRSSRPEVPWRQTDVPSRLAGRSASAWLVPLFCTPMSVAVFSPLLVNKRIMQLCTFARKHTKCKTREDQKWHC